MNEITLPVGIQADTDIARRAFEAGAQGCSGGDLKAIEAELLEVSTKCLRAAIQIGAQQ